MGTDTEGGERTLLAERLADVASGAVQEGLLVERHTSRADRQSGRQHRKGGSENEQDQASAHVGYPRQDAAA